MDVSYEHFVENVINLICLSQECDMKELVFTRCERGLDYRWAEITIYPSEECEDYLAINLKNLIHLLAENQISLIAEYILLTTDQYLKLTLCKDIKLIDLVFRPSFRRLHEEFSLN